MSLVLVVHREQGWLPELTRSVLEQGFSDFELVAIDDASGDHAPAMLDSLAARDQRVRVRHLAQRAGLGAARNMALSEMARGRFVWFVETTDLLPPGALGTVAARLESTSPDVLVVHHSRADVFGATRPGPHAAALEGPAGTLEERSALVALAPEAWNKVFSREFLLSTGARFGAGAHHELSVTWPALLAASRIDSLGEESYVRRRPPNAVVHGSPLDVFAQYEAVFAFDAPEPRKRLVPPSMLRHELSLLARLPEAQREEFFTRMSAAWRAHGGGAALGSRALELRARVVAGGSYPAFRALDEAVGLRRRVRPARVKAVSRKVKRAITPRRNDLQRHYRARLRQPIDPDLAVFAAYWFRGYSCNPRAIYEKARELVPGFHGVWAVNTDGADAVPDGVEYVMAGSREYYDLVARAKWFVNNVNFPNNLVKREGTVHVMTHHGTPLKVMGLDQPQAGPPLLRRCMRWDFSIAQNGFTTPIWERVYPVPAETLEVGYPRDDVLATAGDEETERIRAELGIESGRRVMLYAPTHREYLEGFVPMLDVAAVADRLGPDWVVLARAHYFYDSAEGLAGGRVIDVSAHRSVEELCIASDVLVTDYSSLMFDYGVLDRPIVIHAPDWEEYKERRGVYFDLMAEPPGVITRTEAELVDALSSGSAFGDEANRLRAAFRARFCHLDDGHAAERVVRRVWLGEELPSPAPAVEAVTG
ncbi:MAG TPA: bifunctional glycosyltransferase family 2 protein/CDP-glycerol:glycerophosphate glycerophosphotransferase [Thermoleophilaceae bacterium]